MSGGAAGDVEDAVLPRQVGEQAQRPLGAGALAGTLAGQRFVDFVEVLPEALVRHGVDPFRGHSGTRMSPSSSHRRARDLRDKDHPPRSVALLEGAVNGDTSSEL